MRNLLTSHFKLRPYQEECLASIPEVGAFLVQMATGLGKTVTFSNIPRRGRMLLLSHREELVRQPAKYFPCSFGIEQGKNRSRGESVVSASVQTISRRLEHFGRDDFDLIVTDEAHHAVAKTYRRIFDYFRPRLHVGFTATPNRADGLGLEGIYEDIVFDRDLPWGIKNGWLSDIYCIRARIDFDISQVARRLGDYAPGELEKAVNIESANQAIADVYRQYAKGPTLIFAVSVAHARAIAEKIPGAVAISGGQDRSNAVEAFARGEIPCLVNCMVFTEGTDLPAVETVIIARPTQNIALYTQMVGRGTRLSPGKDHLTLIDCVGVSESSCLYTAPSLVGLEPELIPERVIDEVQGPLFDLPEIVAREMDKPEFYIKNVEYVKLWAKKMKYQLHGVNWFRMPDGSMVLSKPKLRIPPPDHLGRIHLCNGEVVKAQRVYDRVYKWLCRDHSDSRALWDVGRARNGWGAYMATEKQREMVCRMFPETDVTNMTKFEASQILTRVFNG
ncbi:DEAD/DEAH box helicase [Dethiosulfovibrio salsuginis]|nr:DEAD/DEAH box helicase [Dethiosulfovibrio salsuginis]